MQINENDIFKPDIISDKEHIVYPCVKMEKKDYPGIEPLVDNSVKA